jgi:GR25 family glycosyltransferase involved in LPS biosynthesis
MTTTITSLSDIKHAFYINLETRPDRKTHVENQLQNIGVTAERFNAIRLANGAIGCSMSHLKCLEIAKTNGWEHLLIVEDDILFTQPELFKTQINRFFQKQSDFDVLIIAGNIIPPFKNMDSENNSYVKINNCQTTTGYLVKSHYYDKLIQNYKDGIQLLLKNPTNHLMYAVDKYWFRLQEKDNWYMITPLTVVQREDYSDIEKRITNYQRLMTDMDKEWLIKNKAMAEKMIPMSQEMAKPSRKINMKLG